jgi:uncharacterized Zn ribbon protein
MHNSLLYSCPYCRINWIDEDSEVCESCQPKFHIDIILANINSDIVALDIYTNELKDGRLLLLKELDIKLQSLVNRLCSHQK